MDKETRMPEIRTLPPMRTLYVERTGFEGNFQAAAGQSFAAVIAYLDRHNLWGRVGVGIGYMPDDMLSGGERDWRYQAHFPVLDDDPIPGDPDVHEGRLALGKVAVFPHLGAYSTLPAGWSRVYGELLPAAGLAVRNAPCCEIYVGDPGTTPDAELLTELCVPVE